MDIVEFEPFINDIKQITDNNFLLKSKSICIHNNDFLFKIKTSDSFKRITLNKIERLYNIYKNDDYQRKAILNDIQKLFYNSWDGAYSELSTYDFINFVSENPCKIQINDIKKENTLAKYCYKTDVSEIDGYSRDIISFFEIKTFKIRLPDIISRLKSELENNDKEDFFAISTNYPHNIEIKDDRVYAKLKREILEAKKMKCKNLSSQVLKGMHFNFYYEPQIILEIYSGESPYQAAQRLEYFPLQDYKQFVDGHFLKIFFCSKLSSHQWLYCNKDFFRALSRRVFCRLTKIDEKFDENSDLITSFIAKRIGGLLFIVDLSCDSNKIIENPADLYQVYVYSNPNAEFASSFIGYRNFCFQLSKRKVKFDCDNFEYDNY